MGIFDGMESLGFSGISGMSLYDDEGKKNSQQQNNDMTKEAPPVIQEIDYIFEKRVQCPVCDRDFRSKTVKTGKPRLIGSDPDLRPKYSGVDSIKYDVIACPHCGYAALSRFFSYMTSSQAKLIKENVTRTFKGIIESNGILTYDDAINRYKLALLNTVVKKGKSSEKAYTCLKMAWLYRGMAENLDRSLPNAEKLLEEYKANELELTNNAFEGFMVSRTKEEYPICGMDEATYDYLLAILAQKLGQNDISLKLVSAIIVSRTANPKLKDKARDIRDQIKLNG